MEKIKIICPHCNGVPRPLILHTLCNGTGLIDGQPDPICNGTGSIEDDECGFCEGAYEVDWGELPSELEDKLDDIENKLDDIWEKLNE